MKNYIIRELENDKNYYMETIKAIENIEIRTQKNGNEYKTIKTALFVNNGMRYTLKTGKYPSITIEYPGAALTIQFYSWKDGAYKYFDNSEIRKYIAELVKDYESKVENLQKQIDNTEKAIDCFRNLKEDLEKVTGGKNELYKKILENAKYI